MNIYIGGDYKLTSDRLNVIVSRRFEKKDKKGTGGNPTGEYGWKEISFHPNIENACKFVLNQKINSSDAQELTELVELIQTHHKHVEAIFSSLKHLKGASR